MVWHLYVLSFHFMMLGLSYKFSNYQFAGYQYYISQSLFAPVVKAQNSTIG